MGEIIVVERGAETSGDQVGEAQSICASTPTAVNPGDKVGLSIDPANVHVFDKSTGQRLAA